MKKYIVLALVTLAVMAAVRQMPDFLREPAEPVELVHIRQETYQETFTAAGVVEASFERELFPPYPLVPAKVLAEEGDYVRFGQVIAVADPEETVRAVLAAAGEYTGFLPKIIPAETEERLTEFGEQFLQDPEKFPLEIRAPMNGILTALELREGQLYLPAAPAAVVSTAEHLRLRLAIPEERAGRLESGQELLFRTPAVEGGVFSAMIVRLRPAASQRLNGMSYQTVVEAFAAIQDDFDVLRSGYTVQAEIPAEEPETLCLLPYEAVLRDENGQDFVYVVQEGRAVRREIQTGRALSTAVEVTEGLGRYEPVVRDAAALPGECAVKPVMEAEK